MPAVIEEYITDLYARAVGLVFDEARNQLGDATRPGTALFEVAQIRDLANVGLPHFGVLQATPPAFTATPWTENANFIAISAGIVGFGGLRIQVPPQQVPLLARPLSGSYTASHQWGIVIGLSYAEVARSNQSFQSVVSSQTVATSATLPIENAATLAQTLGFPLLAQVGVRLLRFTALTPDGAGFVVDPSWGDAPYRGTVQADQSAGTRVYFLYEPRLSVTYGLPVPVAYRATGNDPAAFSYLPPLAPGCLPLAVALAENPAAPTLSLRTDGTPAILRTALEWPSATALSSADALTLSRSMTAMETALRQVASASAVGDLVRALEEYTRAIADSPTTSFRAYWARAPFRPNEYFARGIGFDNLERFDVSPAFARAYYAITGGDVQHTFAVFRGDRYDVTSGNLPGAPEAAGGASLPAAGALTTLGRGVYRYGVTAVMPTGETIPAPIVLRPTSSAIWPLFVNELWWGAVPGAVDYHVYRRASVAGDQSDYRLTTTGQVTTASITGAVTGGTGTSTPLPTDGTYYALRVLCDVARHVGGAVVRLSTSALPQNGTTMLTASLYDATGNGGLPGAKLRDAGSVPFSVLTTGMGNIPLLFGDAGTGGTLTPRGIDVAAGTALWLVFQAAGGAPLPSGISFALDSGATSGTWLASSPDGVTWTGSGGVSARLRLMAFCDAGQVGTQGTARGILLTGRVAQTARRLSVYVPPIEAPPSGEPQYALSGDTLPLSPDEPQQTQNDLTVTVTARLGASGTPVVLPPVTVPQGTARDTRFPLGTATQLFDRVDSVSVTPGVNLRTTGGSGPSGIAWSVYDLITVETTP